MRNLRELEISVTVTTDTDLQMLRDWNDAEDFVYTMTAKDWMEHLREESEE